MKHRAYIQVESLSKNDLKKLYVYCCFQGTKNLSISMAYQGNGIPSKCFKEQEERQWGQRAIYSGEEMALGWTLDDGIHCKV